MLGMLNTMIGNIAPGMCRLSMYGGIAIKSGDGYKTYDEASGRLVNCENFVFPVGEEFFFVIPTKRAKKGDIILAGGKPKFVLEAEKDQIKALNYETNVVETILPERYLFMGNTYFYGKIVSMFGSKSMRGGKGPGKIMKYMMLSQMLKNGKTEQGSSFGNLLPLFMLSGKGGLDFDDFFDADLDEDDEADIP